MAAATRVRPETDGVHNCGPDTPHRMRVVGYLRGPSELGLDCDKPMRVLCQSGSCAYATEWACGAGRSDRCRPCAARYRRRVATIAFSGVQTRLGTGYAFLLTTTAQSERGAHCMKKGCEVLDGLCRHKLCRCTPVGGVDLADWNTACGKRWNTFRTRLKKAYPSIEFFRGVEVQKRGALHLHVMIWCADDLMPALNWIKGAAMDVGFGHSTDLRPCAPGSRREAAYCAKYVTKSNGHRDRCPWRQYVEHPNRETGEILSGYSGRATYRTWSASRGYGVKMRDVKATDAAHARVKAEIEAALTDALVSGQRLHGMGESPAVEPAAPG